MRDWVYEEKGMTEHGFYLLGDIHRKVAEKELGEEVLNIWRMKRRYEFWEWQRE